VKPARRGAIGSDLNVLIVGAGALGQVFGHHLARGGARVQLLVKSGRQEAARGAFRIWRLRRLRRPLEGRFLAAGVHGDPGRVAAERWDLVFLCVASTALRGDLPARLAAAVGGATVVSIGLGAHDQEVLSTVFPAQQLVVVLPSLLAWQGPLADEIPEAGVAYWVPVPAPIGVGGAPGRGGVVVEALRRGGLRARLVPRAATDGQRLAALAIPYIAALEAAGWSLRALRRDPRLELAAAAAREARSVVVGQQERDLLDRLALSPDVARIVLRLMPHLVPFDLERYLAKHFSKVGAQTRLMLGEWAALAESHRVAATATNELARLLPAPDHDPSEGGA
jgi:2-dehydropantoate 2-reductase